MTIIVDMGAQWASGSLPRRAIKRDATAARAVRSACSSDTGLFLVVMNPAKSSLHLPTRGMTETILLMWSPRSAVQWYHNCPRKQRGSSLPHETFRQPDGMRDSRIVH